MADGDAMNTYAGQMAALEKGMQVNALSDKLKHEDEPKVDEEAVEKSVEPEKGENAVRKVAEILRKAEGSGDENVASEDAEDGDKEREPELEGEGEVEDEKTDDEPKDEPKREALDDELVEIAIRAGLPMSAVKHFPDNASLERAVRDMIEKNAPKEERKEGDEEKDPLEDLTLDPDEYDENIIKIVDELKGQIKELKSKLGEIDEERERVKALERDKQFQSFVNEFESEIDRLSDVGEKLFGKGKLDDLEKNSEQYKNRISLFTEVSRLAEAYSNSGEPVKLDKLVKVATNMLFDDALVKAQVGSKLKKRSGTVVKKPSNRDVPTVKEPKERAVSKVRDMLKSWMS